MKRKNLKFFLIVSILAILSGCCSKKETVSEKKSSTSDEKKSMTQSFEKKPVVVNKEFNGISDSVDYKILNASIVGNELKMKVAYTGGTGTHDFDLVFNGMYMKSLPLKITLYLVHKKENEAGKMEIESDLVFDLSPIQRNSQEIIINLFSFNEKINYTY
ncbi:MAG: hypothetical protein A2W91_15690 [Bacteroidetes bacterium GWF2_38_335]|nr:MAG: hypothetical protein A2W91_15690 [Bacteroidetes bacterium GWF2_38_335]OFY81465.1 MAG: hypothetical protein A2281_13365 [Bacteroidetes bacterium RIFOXYA12_FULL_38_20]